MGLTNQIHLQDEENILNYQLPKFKQPDTSAISSHPDKEISRFRTLSSICSPGCFEREGDEQSAALGTAQTGYPHQGEKQVLNLEIAHQVPF